RIKGPVEYVLGTVQAVYRRYKEEDADYRPLPQQVLVSRLNAMGQQLFAPPNVKGWPGGATWLNTHTVLERGNFAAAVALGTLWTTFSPEPNPSARRRSADPALSGEMLEEPPPPRAYDAARLLEEEGVSRPEEVVRVFLDHYLPGGVRADVRAKLVAFVAEGNPSGPALARRVREAVHAIVAMAEYQLA